MAGTFKGTFREMSGQLAIDGDHATLDGIARVASVDVKDETLATHLQSPDFFDAERFPELRFHAEDIPVDGESTAVQGEITIKGETRPLSATGTISGPMTDAFGNERINLRLAATVDRTEFGVSWNMPLPTGQPALANEVHIDADLYFVKAA
jgi:polyisoprenoid-binding protein YceI